MSSIVWVVVRSFPNGGGSDLAAAYMTEADARKHAMDHVDEAGVAVSFMPVPLIVTDDMRN